MVERKIELKRAYGRKKKMRKLKAKLGTAQGADRETVLAKIRRISPWWTEAGAKQTTAEAPKSDEPKKPKAAPKPKTEKKEKPSA